MSTADEVSQLNQALEIQPGVFCSPRVPDGKLTEYLDPAIRTTHDAFCNGLKLSKNGQCLGMRSGPNLEYEWLSYQQAYDEAHQFGSALLSKDIAAGNDTFIGIFAANCSQWAIAEKAVSMYSMVTVPFYHSYTTDLCRYVVEKTELSAVVCDTVERVQLILQGCEGLAHPPKCVVVMVEDMSAIDMNLAEKLGIEIATWADMIAVGKGKLKSPVPPSAEDISTICFTSGTTGMPKGVVLTHSNLISNIAAVVQHSHFATLTPEDVYMSYLPLPHMYERIVQCMMYQYGCQVGFFRGDIKLLLDDIQALKPTFFSSVPRLLNRIYDKVMQGVHASWLKTMIFNLALGRKKALVERGIITRDSIWDKLVFHKVQDLLGGNVRFTLVGSAPLAGQVMSFVRCALGCEVYEGYGQTEGAAGVTFTLPHETATGHVGSPVSSVLLKVVDVPEMGYFAKDRKGEVCCKGASVMRGYFKDEEKTNEVLDKDGWLHTGDIGEIQPNGTLKLLDRKKHIFKLSRGEYIAPEKMEGVFCRSLLITQIFIDGNSLQDYPVGIVVPDMEVVPMWAAKQGIKVAADSVEMCNDERLRDAIMDDIKKLAKEANLASYEIPSAISLHAEPFTIENDLLTPTMKVKRPVLRRVFEAEIEALYEK